VPKQLVGIVLVRVPLTGGHDVEHVQVGDAPDAGPAAIRAYLEAIGRAAVGVAELKVAGPGDFTIAQRNRGFVVD
jgi:hypothetical protein